MKPAPFLYFAPETLEEALSLLGEHGDEAKVLAGGQSLVPAMNFRLAQPAVLVDLNRASGLDGITAADGCVRIGSMTRQREAERSAAIASGTPLLHRALPFVAHPQIRNRGTIGGSLAHADPAAELPAIALVLQARLRLKSVGGARTLEAGDFYTGLFETALGDAEVLSRIEIDEVEPRTGTAFLEFSRRHGDYGLAGVATSVRLDEAGVIVAARIGLLGVGEGPVLAQQASLSLVGESVGRQTPGGAGAALEAGRVAAAIDIDPPGDIHASSDFRRHLVGVLTERALIAAFADARQEGGSTVG